MFEFGHCSNCSRYLEVDKSILFKVKNIWGVVSFNLDGIIG